MDLNVAVIMKWVDRLSAPAAGSARALGRFSSINSGLAKGSLAVTRASTTQAQASAGLSKAQAAGAVASTRLAAATETVARASAAAAAPVQALGSVTTRTTETADRLALSAVQAASGTERSGQAAEVASRRFSLLERTQFRSRAATRALGGEMAKLETQLGKLAIGSIAVEGLERAGHALTRPLEEAIRSAAKFTSGMTGFGITAELSDAQMKPIRSAILRTAPRLGLSPEDVIETYAFTRRSGVFRRPDDIMAAGAEAARFQKLAQRMGSAVTGEDVAGGASSAVREYGFSATPKGLRRFSA